MKLSEILLPHHTNMDLQSSTKEEVIDELTGMLDVAEEHKPILAEMVNQREQLGSTGLGGGIAIPHGRSLIVNSLYLVCGVSKKGVFYQSMDRKKVYLFFLIIAPHREVSNQYLPLLGNLARLASESANIDRLRESATPEEFIKTLQDMNL